MKGATFNQLNIFHTIVQEGSIRGAARKLEMAPPSVSQSLKQLENLLQLPLFTRTTRRIELTEAGDQLYQRTVQTLTDLDYALESVRDLSTTPSGKVRITLPRFVFQFFLRPVYADFCRQYPDIELEISVSDEAMNIVKEGYDLGIRFGDRVEEGMVARQLVPPMKEALFASPEYIACHGRPDHIRNLKIHRLIQYRFIAANRIASLILKDQGQDVTVDMPTALVVNDTDAMVDAARRGLGIGRIVNPMIADEIAAGHLLPILEQNWYPYPGLYLYFSQNSQKARRVRVFIDFLLEAGQAKHLKNSSQWLQK